MVRGAGPAILGRAFVVSQVRGQRSLCERTLLLGSRVLRSPSNPAAWHDFAVDFDCDAAFTVSRFGEQRGDRGGGRAFVRLAIEKNLHLQSVTPRDASVRPDVHQ